MEVNSSKWKDGDARLDGIHPRFASTDLFVTLSCFRSMLDVLVLSNVLDLAIGGIWALYLTGTNFQHVGRGRFCLALRRGHHGWIVVDLLLQRPAVERTAGP